MLQLTALSFFAASVVLFLIWIYVYMVLRNRPEDVNLEPIAEEDEDPDDAGEEARSHNRGHQSSAVDSPCGAIGYEARQEDTGSEHAREGTEAHCVITE